MLFDYLPDDRQPQPDPEGLGAEHGFEQARQHVIGNAHAGVAELDFQTISLATNANG
jgi:hypothetical protein